MYALYRDVLVVCIPHINVEVIAKEHLPVHRRSESFIHVNTFASEMYCQPGSDLHAFSIIISLWYHPKSDYLLRLCKGVLKSIIMALVC